MISAIEKQWWYGQPLIIALLVHMLFVTGGCAPKMLAPLNLPPEQRAHIRGTFGGAVFAGAQILAIDGERLASENSAYISPGMHKVKLQYNRPGGGTPVGPVVLEFEAEAGREYITKWHYSWSKSYYYFSIEDEKTGKVIAVGGETPP